MLSILRWSSIPLILNYAYIIKILNLYEVAFIVAGECCATTVSDALSWLYSAAKRSAQLCVCRGCLQQSVALSGALSGK